MCLTFGLFFTLFIMPQAVLNGFFIEIIYLETSSVYSPVVFENYFEMSIKCCLIYYGDKFLLLSLEIMIFFVIYKYVYNLLSDHADP